MMVNRTNIILKSVFFVLGFFNWKPLPFCTYNKMKSLKFWIHNRDIVCILFIFWAIMCSYMTWDLLIPYNCCAMTSRAFCLHSLSASCSVCNYITCLCRTIKSSWLYFSCRVTILTQIRNNQHYSSIWCPYMSLLTLDFSVFIGNDL